MPSPFSSKKPNSQAGPGGQENNVLQVTNSVLVCEVCFAETSEGDYFPGQKRLVFKCPEGHVNVVKGIEL